MKKILILNTSHNDLGLIRALKKMNLYVISIGNREGLVGQQYVDEYICMDYSQKEEVLKLARKLEIDGVCACCNDFGVITAAYVAEKMKLKGYDTFDNILTIHHKNRFKKFAIENNILTTRAEEFNNVADAKEYVKQEAKYPIIVKPVDLSAGNGIHRADEEREALEVIDIAFHASRVKKIIIEPFIEGKQYGFCTFIRQRKVVAYCSNNEYSFVNPYRVEIDTFPADDIDRYKDILIEQVESMVQKLQLEDGIFHIQYIVSNGKIYILEAMRRVLGNMYGIPANQSNDFDWDYWQARVNVGLGCDDVPKRMEAKGYFAYRAIMAQKNGKIKNIYVDDSIKQYIKSEVMLWKPGQRVNNHMSETLGLLFFEFPNRDVMKRVMLEAYDRVYVEMEE